MKNAAVVGFGFMGMTHARNIMKLRDLHLSAIVDPNPALFSGTAPVKSGNINTGDSPAGEFESVSKYADLDKCLDSEDIDAVIICVHTGLHYEMAMKALGRGKHVFVEKPFCLDISQAQEIIDLSRQKDRILMVGHVVRFMSPYRLLKEWSGNETFGKPEFFHFWRFCGVPAWGQWNEEQTVKASGGALFDLVIHDIDFASYVLGAPDDIRSVSIAGRQSSHDYISAIWNYPSSGINVRIEGGNIFHGSFPFTAGYSARFERASVHYSTSNGNEIIISDETEVKKIPTGDPGAGYYEEMSYFSDCIATNRQPSLCMPESSLGSVALCYRHI